MPTTHRNHERPRRVWPFPILGRSILLTAGIGLVLLALYPFWGAIAVAAVFALGTFEPMRKLAGKVGRRHPRLTVGVAVFLLSLFMLLPVTFFSFRLYNLATAPRDASGSGLFSSRTLNRMASAKEQVESTAVSYGVKAKLFRNGEEAREAVRSGSGKMLNGALAVIPATIASVPDLFLTVLVFCLFLYLFLSRGSQIRDLAVRYRILPTTEIGPIARVLQASCYNSIVSNFIIGFIQATIVAVGARIGGYSEVVLIFSVVFVLSFIPFIGSSPLAFLLAGLSLLNHNGGSAVILLVTGIISGTIDNVIRPYLVANGENEVHPIVSFAVIIGAIAILGIKGIFLGPVILTSTVGLLNLPRGAQGEEGLSEKRRAS